MKSRPRRRCRVVIAGGGTAGHVLPGLAIAQALVDRGVVEGSDDVHFVGSRRGIERTLVPTAGFPLTLLPGRGIQRRLAVANVGAILGLGLAATTGSLWALHALGGSGHRAEVLVLTGANLAVTVVRFASMRTWVFARYYANLPFGRLVASLVGRFEYRIVQNQDRRILDTLPKGPVQQGEYAYGEVDTGSILWFQKRDELRMPGQS